MVIPVNFVKLIIKTVYKIKSYLTIIYMGFLAFEISVILDNTFKYQINEFKGRKSLGYFVNGITALFQR